MLLCSEALAATSIEYHALSSSKMRNPNVSTEIQGGIRTGGSDSCVTLRYAVATLDGTLMLVEDESVIWYVTRS
jgi:hypothetical protein